VLIESGVQIPHHSVQSYRKLVENMDLIEYHLMDGLLGGILWSEKEKRKLQRQ
jgi:hypothetical protein